ncbi:hypothetical protein WICMUC_005875 [Wickerhamomyces mucosus]|uniref:Cyclin N-terminal domain-containing protein n=1 Tax=Wickerhamomyces mucosus TaxID=1378264 RepID=A0A9P8T3L6_9ASCO|nr:hypothetical protein WICMUC_005875 [Wickerhamomyces mucosus]
MNLSFITPNLFIQLATQIYTSQDSRYTYTSNCISKTNEKDLLNLIKLTKLTDYNLIHSLYLFQKLSKNSIHIYIRSIDELYLTLVIILMISNKYIDDYSFTLKTWSSLSNFSNEILISKEIQILTRLNYKLQLNSKELNLFIKYLKKFIVFNYPSPKSPNRLFDINGIDNKLDNNMNLLSYNYNNNNNIINYNGLNYSKRSYVDESPLQTKKSKKIHLNHFVNCECCKLTNLMNNYHLQLKLQHQLQINNQQI